MNFSMRRVRARCAFLKGKVKLGITFIFCTVLIFTLDHFLGLVAVILEKDFESDFSYPLDVDNFPALIENFRNGEPVEYKPINRLYSQPKFLVKADASCEDFQLMLIMVKSAPSNFHQRNVIRSTWGHPQYLKNISNLIRANKLVTNSNNNRFSLPKRSHEPRNSVFKLVFLIGLLTDDEKQTLPTTDETKDKSAQITSNDQFFSKDTSPDTELKRKLENSLQHEITKHNDIVRIETVDSYENNTFKTMMGIRWATEICTDFEYSLFVDDDMFISLKNLLLFLESPATYPDGEPEDSDSESVGQIVDANRLFAGKVLFTKPVRQRIGSYSKWYLPLNEYPYNYFPRYMPAAAIVMSKQVVEDFYYASFYTKHFRFDDIFLGIMAYKMNIIPFSCSYFYVCHTEDGKCPGLPVTKRKPGFAESSDEEDPEDLSLTEQMEHVIARHGVSPDQLADIWRELTLSGRI